MVISGSIEVSSRAHEPEIKQQNLIETSLLFHLIRLQQRLAKGKHESWPRGWLWPRSQGRPIAKPCRTSMHATFSSAITPDIDQSKNTYTLRPVIPSGAAREEVRSSRCNWTASI